jgi:hypothetical protein
MKNAAKTGVLMIAAAGVASLITAIVSWVHRRSAAGVGIFVTDPSSKGGQTGRGTITLTTTNDASAEADATRHRVEITIDRAPLASVPQENAGKPS